MHLLSSRLKICLTFTIGLLLFFSCSRGERGGVPSSSLPDSSRAELIVAVLPTFDCYPIAVALQDSTFRRLGLSVRLKLYRSQMEAEQALVEGKVDVCASDIFRVAVLQNQHQDVKLLFSTRRDWRLCANKQLRANKIADVSSRMIAGTRNSTVDFLADEVETRLNTQNGPMLRPQINDVLIRERMLASSQLDAALLPLPLALVAAQKGCKQLFRTDKYSTGLSGFAVNGTVARDEKKREQLDLFRQAYDQSAGRISRLSTLPSYPRLDRLFYIESLKEGISPNKYFAPSAPFDTVRIADAMQWLRERSLLRADYKPDTLLSR